MSMVSIEDSQPSLNFEYQAGRPFSSFTTEKEVIDSLTKWGLSPERMVAQHYTVDGAFRRGDAKEFVTALFNSPSFQSNFRVADGRGGLNFYAPHCKVASVDLVPLTATATSLDIFDKLVGERPPTDDDSGEIIAREGGGVARCMDIFLSNDVTVSNHLRAVFMLPPDDCEFYGALSRSDRQEFITHVMHRLVAGGPLCQWDDELDPYKDATRAVYKDMVVVAKRPGDGGGSLEVQSIVYQVRGATLSDGTEMPLFPKENDNSNFFYISVHPTRRALSVWYSAYWAPF